MAGQSEGVGVLVAIFVTLAVLGVGAAVYLWLELDKAKLSQAAAEQSKSEADQLAASLQADLTAIRSKIDHAEGSAQEAIERLTTMIQRYNGDNPDQRVQVAFEYQSTQIQNLRTQVQELNSNLQETSDKLKAIEIEHKEYVKTHQNAKEQAQRQTQVLMTEKEQQRKDKDAEIDRLIKEREDAVRRERQLERDITAERKEMGLKLELVRRKLAQAVEQIKGDGGGRLFEGPDGVVLRASARLGLAYINLGVEDRVRPGMTFSVYAYGVEGSPNVAPKGSIEIKKILGGHYSEARITRADPSNPIVENDQIYSPLYDKQWQERFALAGSLDIDGDGRDDRDIVKKIIRLSGGRVDCEVGLDGRIDRNVEIDTNWLVMGAVEQDVQNATEAQMENIKRHTEAVATVHQDAVELGVPVINLRNFLRYMGYQPKKRLVTDSELGI